LPIDAEAIAAAVEEMVEGVQGAEVLATHAGKAGVDGGLFSDLSSIGLCEPHKRFQNSVRVFLSRLFPFQARKSTLNSFRSHAHAWLGSLTVIIA
jgi:hypothetical protein